MTDPIINKSASRLIWIAEPSLGEEERLALGKCATDNWISQGPRVAEFENQIAKLSGRSYGSACNSGTTALHLALHVCDVAAGDEVIVPNLTMIAVANSVLLTGASPVFAEVKNDVGNVSLESISERITNKTKAVIIVHTYGEPVEDTKKIKKLCEDKNIKLIEDCAESHFGSLDNMPLGSFGDLAVFSFYSNKNITTGEGGMVVTDDLEVKERLDRVRMHAFTPGEHFCHTEKAFGYRMTDMQAAIGLEQIKKAPGFMNTRRTYRGIYESELKNINHITIPKAHETSGLWVMPVLATNKESRDKIRKHMADHGIDSRTYFQPLHRQAFLEKFSNKDFARSDELSNRGFYAPLYPKLSEDDVRYVCQVIKEYKE